MALFLVRHAKAGSRSEWSGEDRLRPLTPTGWTQARAIADRLGTVAGELHTSPYLRCRQTLEPLATRLGQPIEECPALTEGAGFGPLLDLLGTLPDGTVMCSHGDVIPAVIDALVRRGAHLIGEPSWRKGVIWTLTRAAGDSAIASVEATDPDDSAGVHQSGASEPG